MSFGAKQEQSSSQNSLSPDAASRWNQWAQPALRDATQPFQAYTGQLAPGLSAGQQQATQMANADIGAGQSAVNQGVNAAQAGATYASTPVTAGMLSGVDMSKYMDPYTQNVIDTTNQNIDQQRQRDINSTAGQNVAAGAFGGSREGVADSLTNEAYGRLAAQTDANLQSQGYSNAQQAALTDIGNNLAAQEANQNSANTAAGIRLTGAGMLGSLGQTQQQLGMNDTGLIDTLGSQAQQTQAGQDTAAYNNYQYGRQFPLTQAGILAGLMGATPYSTNNKQSGSSTQEGLKVGFSAGPFTFGG